MQGTASRLAVVVRDAVVLGQSLAGNGYVVVTVLGTKIVWLTAVAEAC